MRALSELDRKDVIRAVALISVVAFPLMAYAQLGPRLAKPPTVVTPAVAETAAPASAAAGDACANQHWPFFSAECLRGSPPAVAPRLVSMNEDNLATERAAKPAMAISSAHVARSTPDHAPRAKSRKPAKPRVARARDRRPISLAADSEAVRLSTLGW